MLGKNIALLALSQQGLDLGNGVTDGRNGHVMVDGCDEVGSILGAVHVIIPITGKQLGLAVGQIGTQHSGQNAILHCLVKLCKAAGEQGEGCVADDVLGTTLLQFAGNLQHGFAGGNDVINDEYRLATDALTQILMGNDGIAAVSFCWR